MELREEERIQRGTGIEPRLVELRKVYEKQIPWGYLYGLLSPDELTIQFAWKDQNVVLFMSTSYTGFEVITHRR